MDSLRKFFTTFAGQIIAGCWICLVSFLLVSCTNVKHGGSQVDGSAGALTGNGPDASTGGKLPSLTGDWRIGYKFNNQTLNASVHLQQKGTDFQGSGKDEPSGSLFSIDQGQIHGNQITFVKRYTGNLSNSPPIEYAGTLTMSNQEGYKGPYLNGDYSAPTPDGKTVNNEWDAIRDTSTVAALTNTQAPSPPNNASHSLGQSAASSSSSAQPPSAVPSASGTATHSSKHSDKPPDLSGKWELAYEYNFRTVKSIMFLEQEWDHLVGHGLDDTKEKFVIEKGMYQFPKVTMTRKYQNTPVKVRGRLRALGKERIMIFRGDVSYVEESDYQGPYMHGKTDGGGSWEAQLVK